MIHFGLSCVRMMSISLLNCSASIMCRNLSMLIITPAPVHSNGFQAHYFRLIFTLDAGMFKRKAFSMIYIHIYLTTSIYTVMPRLHLLPSNFDPCDRRPVHDLSGTT